MMMNTDTLFVNHNNSRKVVDKATRHPVQPLTAIGEQLVVRMQC